MSERSFEKDLHRDYYQRLRKRVTNWASSRGRPQEYAEYLLAAPDLFHLLVKLSLDGDVSWTNRGKLVAAIAYFVSPVDVIPEVVFGPIGLIDDIGLAAYVIRELMDEVGREKIKRYWAGQRHVLVLIEDVLDFVDDKIGSGAWDKITSVLTRNN